MVAKRKIKNSSHLSYSKHCIETQNSARRMIISSGNVLPAEARSHHSVRAEKASRITQLARRGEVRAARELRTNETTDLAVGGEGAIPRQPGPRRDSAIR